ncbi:MAG: hypothetical protein ACJ8AO_12820 [Gemmatimonadaceae bacterium]
MRRHVLSVVLLALQLPLLAACTRDAFSPEPPAAPPRLALAPLPVTEADAVAISDARPTTDFLWQRSPFLLTGGKDGTTASAGIDFILPYWMARYYGVPLF